MTVLETNQSRKTGRHDQGNLISAIGRVIAIQKHRQRQHYDEEQHR